MIEQRLIDALEVINRSTLKQLKEALEIAELTPASKERTLTILNLKGAIFVKEQV